MFVRAFARAQGEIINNDGERKGVRVEGRSKLSNTRPNRKNTEPQQHENNNVQIRYSKKSSSDLGHNTSITDMTDSAWGAFGLQAIRYRLKRMRVFTALSLSAAAVRVMTQVAHDGLEGDSPERSMLRSTSHLLLSTRIPQPLTRNEMEHWFEETSASKRQSSCCKIYSPSH